MKKLIALLLALVMVLAMAACTPKTEAPKNDAPATDAPAADAPADPAPEPVAPETTEPADNTEDTVTIGIPHYSTADQGACVYANMAKAYCDEKGWKYVFLDANNDAEKQAKDFSDLINMGVDAILTVPVDSATCSDSVLAANEAGIPVAMMDRSVEEGDYLCLVQSDNVEHGYQSGVAMKEAAAAAGIDPADLVVIELLGDMTSSAGKERKEGFEKAAEEFGFDIVWSADAGWVADQGYNAVMDGFTAHPEANALFLPSDNCYAAAALSALEQLGLKKAVGEEGHIIITCVDGGPDALNGIRDKWIDATASQQISYMPTAALDFIAGYFNGEYEATAGETIALAPVVVTEENVDDDALWANQPF